MIGTYKIYNNFIKKKKKKKKKSWAFTWNEHDTAKYNKSSSSCQPNLYTHSY
jgi:hypothetical protein